MQIGARLRLLRQRRGMSRATLARELNISNQQIQKYESGQNRITAGLLPKLAQLFGIPISYIFEDLPESTDGGAAHRPLANVGGARQAAIVGLTVQCLAFIRMFVTIKDPKARASIVALVKSLGGNDESEP